MGRSRRVALLLVLALAALPAVVALAAKAPINVHGTTWYFTATVQEKLSKVGGFKTGDEFLLYLGPNVAQSLNDDQFKLRSDMSDHTYTGTWDDPKSDGKVVLDFQIGQVEAYLTDDVTGLLEDAFNDVQNVSVDVTKFQVKTKLDPNKNKATTSAKASFVGTADVDGEHGEGKGTFSIKGKGVLAP